jgi:hypothetical protein
MEALLRASDSAVVLVAESPAGVVGYGAAIMDARRFLGSVGWRASGRRPVRDLLSDWVVSRAGRPRRIAVVFDHRVTDEKLRARLRSEVEDRLAGWRRA